MEYSTLYTTGYPSSSDLFSDSLLAIIFGIFIVCLILIGILYFFNAYGMYKFAENYNKANGKTFEYPWLAWIPMVCNYFLGTILAEISKDDERPLPNEHLPIIFLVVPFVAGAVAGIEELATISTLVSTALTGYASFLLASKYSKNVILGTILGTLFFPFYIFALRKAPLKEKEFLDTEIKL